MTKKVDEQALHDLNQKFLECRVLRHRWSLAADDPKINSKYPESATVHRICKKCDRCKTRTVQALSRVTGGRLGGPHYGYPDGYSLGSAGVKPWNSRVEYINRTVGPPKR